jgi:Response regulators consisting of a CheY-like receiver domain and a winged-helix DNA-binding domain
MITLVVDDDEKIVKALAAYLINDGYEVQTAFDGPTALMKAREIKPDIILLDIMLPGIDGLSVCREIRKNSQVPIIMLTARDAETDKIIGLEIGADDYVVKPFSPREVMARIRAILRRVSPMKQEQHRSREVLCYGDISLDLINHTLLVEGVPTELTPTEFRLLELFLTNPTRTFSRLQLIEKIQGVAFEGYERTVDTHIKNLRKKIGDSSGEPRYIKTVYGVGYRLVGGK